MKTKADKKADADASMPVSGHLRELRRRVLVCVVLLIAVFKTNVYATLIPMLFPQIGIFFRAAAGRKRAAEQPGEEGSDLID